MADTFVTTHIQPLTSTDIGKVDGKSATQPHDYNDGATVVHQEMHSASLPSTDDVHSVPKTKISSKSEVVEHIHCKPSDQTSVAAKDEQVRDHGVENLHSCHVCVYCGESFGQIKSLDCSKRNAPAESSVRKVYKCQDCGYASVEIVQLIEHKKEHEKVEPFPCSICGKKFSTRKVLSDHEQIHKMEGKRSQEMPPSQKSTQISECTNEKNVDKLSHVLEAASEHYDSPAQPQKRKAIASEETLSPERSKKCHDSKEKFKKQEAPESGGKTSPGTTKRQSWSVKEKVEIVQWHRDNGRNQRLTAVKWGCDRKSIRDWDKNYPNLLELSVGEGKNKRKVKVFSESQKHEGENSKECQNDLERSREEKGIAKKKLQNRKESESPPGPSRRQSWSVKDKVSIVQWYRSAGRNVQLTVLNWGCDRKSLREWDRNYKHLLELSAGDDQNKRKMHSGVPPLSQDLDFAVLRYFNEEYDNGRLLKNHMIQKKAQEVATELGINDFKASNGWVNRWKRRNGISAEEMKTGAVSFEVPLTANFFGSHSPHDDDVVVTHHGDN